MKRLRITLLVFVLLILACGGVGIAWLASHEDRLTEQLLRELDERLITDAHIEKIELDLWSHFPDVSLVLNGVWAMDSFGSNDTLIQAGQIQLACHALALLRGQYELSELSISDAQLNLQSTEDGQWNTDVWRTARADTTSSSASFSIQNLTFLRTAVRADNRTVHVDEARVQIAWSDTGLFAIGEGIVGTAETPEFKTKSPLDWAGEFRWNPTSEAVWISLTEVLWKGLEAQFEVEKDGGPWRIEGHASHVSLSAFQALVPLPSPWNKLSSATTASGSLTWADNVFKSNWMIDSGTWEVPWEDRMVNTKGDARIWVTFDSGRWRADAPAVNLQSEGWNWKGAVNRIDFKTGTFQTEGAGQVDWGALEKGLLPSGNEWPHSGLTTWNGKAERRASGWEFEGAFTADKMAGEWKGVPWTAQATGEVNKNMATVSSFQAQWDEIQLDGDLEIDDFNSKDKPTSIGGTIHLPQWAYAATDSSETFALQDMQLPAGIAVDLEAEVGHVAYENWSLDTVQFRLTGDPSQWQVSRFKASTLEGSLTGDGQCSFAPDGSKAAFLIHPNVVHCDLPSLFRAFNDFDQTTLRSTHLSGKLEVSGSVQFDLLTNGEWDPSSLDVLGASSIEHGSLKDLEAFEDIADYLRGHRMMAPLVDPDDLSERLADVTFDHLESPVYISRGVVQIPTVEIRSSAMNITLEGQYGFDSSIDYTLGFAMRDLRSARESEFGPIEDDGLGQQFFISMQGTVQNPVYSWDREAQKNHRKENFQREKELLKDLFRKSTP